MKTLSNQIIAAMPMNLINEFRRKSFCLMLEMIEDVEMRYGNLSNEEIQFLKVFQSIPDHQERFDAMCEAFGKLMYMQKVLTDRYKSSETKVENSQPNLLTLSN